MQHIMIMMAMIITMNFSVQLPGYKRELRDGVCEFGMGEGQKSEIRQLRFILSSIQFNK